VETLLSHGQSISFQFFLHHETMTFTSITSITSTTHMQMHLHCNDKHVTCDNESNNPIMMITKASWLSGRLCVEIVIETHRYTYTFTSSHALCHFQIKTNEKSSLIDNNIEETPKKPMLAIIYAYQMISANYY
jgi:hypothetical protein